MDAAAFTESVTLFGDRRPFRPFVIEQVDGSCLRVDCPGILIAKGGVAVGFALGRIPVRVDHQDVTAVLIDVVEAE